MQPVYSTKKTHPARNLFYLLGRFVVKGRLGVLIIALAFLAFASVWGTGAFGSLTGGGGFEDPGSESGRADQILAGPLGRYAADVVVIYESKEMTVDDAGFAEAVQQALSTVDPGGVTRLESYWTTGSSDFVSTDRHTTYAIIQLPGTDDQTRVSQYNEIKDGLMTPGLDVRFGGITAMTEQVNSQTGRDIIRAEILSIPLLLILLVLIFRSAIAAMLPLAIGAVTALGSLVVLRLITGIIPISTFAINVLTILGLGLAIDYALFIVNRFREELNSGQSVDDAVARTMATAGRTVAFSGLTLGMSLAGLTLFPSQFLSSMGYSSVAVTLFAVLSALTVLPALLSYTGHRINSLRVPLPKLRRATQPGKETAGSWYKVAHAAMRRPLLTTLSIVVLLLALGSPFLDVNWGRPGEWVLPAGTDSRVVSEELGEKFPSDPTKYVTAVVSMPESVSAPGAQENLRQYLARLSEVEGVENASITGSHENYARLSLQYSADPQSIEAREMVAQLRELPQPEGADSLFTGRPASMADMLDSINSRMPWMAVFVTVISFILLFLAFGSVVLPLKSVLMNLLSLLASFGAIKLIFQDGFLSDLLNFVPVGSIDINMPVLILAIAFGLSMDYEIFLLSRIREHWESSGDPVESVAIGVQRTAKIITSAALLLIVVVGGFMFSEITFMKMIGVGLVIAIAIDATIVRGILVPSTMKLLGRWAWWSPAPLMRWWERYGVKE